MLPSSTPSNMKDFDPPSKRIKLEGTNDVSEAKDFDLPSEKSNQDNENRSTTASYSNSVMDISTHSNSDVDTPKNTKITKEDSVEVTHEKHCEHSTTLLSTNHNIQEHRKKSTLTTIIDENRDGESQLIYYEGDSSSNCAVSNSSEEDRRHLPDANTSQVTAVSHEIIKLKNEPVDSDLDGCKHVDQFDDVAMNVDGIVVKNEPVDANLQGCYVQDHFDRVEDLAIDGDRTGVAVKNEPVDADLHGYNEHEHVISNQGNGSNADDDQERVTDVVKIGSNGDTNGEPHESNHDFVVGYDISNEKDKATEIAAKGPVGAPSIVFVNKPGTVIFDGIISNVQFIPTKTNMDQTPKNVTQSNGRYFSHDDVSFTNNAECDVSNENKSDNDTNERTIKDKKSSKSNSTSTDAVKKSKRCSVINYASCATKEGNDLSYKDNKSAKSGDVTATEVCAPTITRREPDMAFCCNTCYCSEATKKRSGYVIISCTNSGNEKLYHNFCCHDIPMKEKNDDWLSPLIQAALNGYEKEPTQKISPKSLDRLIQNAESSELNFKQYFEPTDLNHYENSCDDYITLLQKDKKLEPLVVLDIFSGIGQNLVALKRLGIDIKTYIHVDDDPVARRVAKHNNSENDIEFIDRYDLLDTVKVNLDTVLKCHGPIDLVFGAVQSSALMDFQGLVMQIKRHPLQKGRSVFYLCETDLKSNLRKIDITKLSKSFGSPPLVIDSKDYSPCSKQRSYWLNLPIDKAQQEYLTVAAKNSEPILDDNFQMPEEVRNRTTEVPTKAKSLQHLFANIDDHRMLKVKKQENTKSYETQTFSVADRENMLGLKEGYVGQAVRYLFNNLKQEAFMVEFHKGQLVKESVINEYVDMLKCKYNFKPSADFFEILISPLSKKPVYLDCEKYAKYLLGKSSSIPVKEFLLSPLKKISDRKEYGDANYDYAWA